MPIAPGSSATASSNETSGSAIGGSPDGTGPSTWTPRAGRSRATVATSDATSASERDRDPRQQPVAGQHRGEDEPAHDHRWHVDAALRRARSRATRRATPGSTAASSTPPRTDSTSARGLPPRILGIWLSATVIPTPVM